METPTITLRNMTDGMPPHPFIPDRPVIWADPGDTWLFRKTTNILVPKSVESISDTDTLVRYTACAIKRALENGGGVDFVIWQELEEVQIQEKTSVVVPVLCFGPSRAEHIDVANQTIDAAMVAFKEVYKDPRWIVQFGPDVEEVPHVI